MDFVEICNVCAKKVIIKAAKRIFNSDKICRSYCDFYFGVTFFGTHCISYIKLLSVAYKAQTLNTYMYTLIFVQPPLVLVVTLELSVVSSSSFLLDR